MKVASNVVIVLFFRHTLLTLWTTVSLLVVSPKAAIICPKMIIKMGCDAPVATAETVPTSIRTISLLSAYLNSSWNFTLPSVSMIFSFLPFLFTYDGIYNSGLYLHYRQEMVTHFECWVILSCLGVGLLGITPEMDVSVLQRLVLEIWSIWSVWYTVLYI